MKAYLQLDNGRVELSLHPMNTYTIIRQTGLVQKALIAHVQYEQLETTIAMILDHEKPQPNVKFIIEQD